MTLVLLNQSGIYEILNTVNGKRYIGSAKNFSKRWWGHTNPQKRAQKRSKGLLAFNAEKRAAKLLAVEEKTIGH